MWDLIVSVPDHCLSFYFSSTSRAKMFLSFLVHICFTHTHMLYAHVHVYTCHYTCHYVSTQEDL